MSIESVKIRNYSVDYIKFGEGEKVFVILPGLSLTPVTPSYEFIEQKFKIFTKDYTCYLFDRPTEIGSSITIKELADIQYDVLISLGLNKVTIYGTSQGGMIAQQIAIDHTKLTEKLVIASSSSRASRKSQGTIDKWVALAKEGNLEKLNHSFNTMIFSSEYYEKFKLAFEHLEKTTGKQSDLPKFIVMANACSSINTFKYLKKIKCPTLVLGSKNDLVLGKEGTLDIAKKIGCKYILFEQYGHAVYDECPTFLNTVLEFLQK